MNARIPALIAGLFMLIGGVVFERQIDKKAESQRAIYHRDRQEFVQSEFTRTIKLHEGFKRYTWVYALLAVASIALIYFFRQSVVGGIGWVLLLFSLFTVANETNSARHSGKYLEALERHR